MGTRDRGRSVTRAWAHEKMDLKALERRVYRESVQDGIMEILMGCLLAACGLVMSNPKALGAFVGIYVIGLILLRRTLEALKRRFTYPRIGEAALRQEKPTPLLGGIFLFILAAGALVALGLTLLGRLTTAEWYRWLPVCIGLCLAGAFWHVYSKSGSPRYLVYAVVALGAGFAAGSPRLPERMDNIALYLICMGGLLILTGAVLLIRFLRAHPIAADAGRGL